MQRPGRRKLDLVFQEEPEIVRQIDAIVKAEGLSRSAVIRRLVKLGLESHARREKILEESVA